MTSIPGPSRASNDAIAKLYAGMSDEVLTKHIEVILAEVARRHSVDPPPPEPERIPTPVPLRNPKIELEDEKYLVVHEKASGVRYNAKDDCYYWTPRLSDVNGPRRVNELNNYSRDLLKKLKEEERAAALEESDSEEEEEESVPSSPPTPVRSVSRPSAKYWSRKGGDPIVECKCSVCNAQFDSLRNLLDHRLEKHSQQVMLTCGFCEKVFQKRTHVYTHLTQEYKVHHCETCSFSFASKWHMDKHKCDIPRDIQSSSMTSLVERRSSRAHSVKNVVEDDDDDEEMEDVIMKCENCGKSYTQIHWFEKHREKCVVVAKKEENQNLNLKCANCFRHYNSQYWLDRHMEKCSPLKPTLNQCSICSKTFETEISLKYHLRRCNKTSMPVLYDSTMDGGSDDDNEEKEEEVAGRAGPPNITEESDKEEEEEDKANVMKFKCSLCSLECIGMTSLVGHRRRIHGELAMLTCNQCGQTFNSLSSIRRHMNQEFNIYRCPTCNRNCQDRTNLQFHSCFSSGQTTAVKPARSLTRTQIKCASCQATFATSSLLYYHRMTCQQQLQHLQRAVTLRLSEGGGGGGGQQPSTSGTPSSFSVKRARAQSVMMPVAVVERTGVGRTTDEVLKCSECSYECNYLSILAAHRQKMHGHNKFSCNFCPRSFATYRSLHDHHVTEIGKWRCSKCGQVFPRKYQLTFHERHCEHGEQEEVEEEQMLIVEEPFEQ